MKKYVPDLVTRSDAAKYLDISGEQVDKYLRPVMRDGKPHKKGREFAYFRVDLIQAKIEKDKAEKRARMTTLGPENLDPSEKEKLDGSSLIYEAWCALGDRIGELSEPQRKIIEGILGKNETYTGDKIIKSISYGWSTKIKLKPSIISKYVDPSVLEREGVIETGYNEKVWMEGGREIIRDQLYAVLQKFEKICKRGKVDVTTMNQKAFNGFVTDFSKKYGVEIPPSILKRMLTDYKNQNLTDDKLGNYARNLFTRTVSKKLKTRNLRITMADKQLIEQIARGRAEKLDFPELQHVLNLLLGE
jgi:hypothetical protein